MFNRYFYFGLFTFFLFMFYVLDATVKNEISSLVIETSEFEKEALVKQAKKVFKKASRIYEYEDFAIINMLFSFFKGDLKFSKRMCFKIIYTSNKDLYEDVKQNEEFLLNKAYYIEKNDFLGFLNTLGIGKKQEIYTLAEYKDLQVADNKKDLMIDILKKNYNCQNEQDLIIFFNTRDVDAAIKILPYDFSLNNISPLVYRLDQKTSNLHLQNMLKSKLSGFSSLYFEDNCIKSNSAIDYFNLLENCRNHYYIEIALCDISEDYVEDLKQGNLVRFKDQFFKKYESFLIDDKKIQKAIFLYRYKQGIFIYLNRRFANILNNYPRRYFVIILHKVDHKSDNNKAVMADLIRYINKNPIYIEDLSRKEALALAHQLQCKYPQIVIRE